MKLNKLFSVIALAVAVMMAACGPQEGPPDPNQQGNQGNQGQNDPDPTTAKGDTVQIPAGIEIPAGAITVSKAREIGEALEDQAISTEKYYIHGWIKKLASKHEEGMTGDYGNAVFYMSENCTKNDKGELVYDSDDFYAYQVYAGEGKKKFHSLAQIAVGDYVVIYSQITKYGTTIETPGGSNEHGFVVASSNPEFYKEPEIPEIDSDNDGSLEKPYSVADVKTLNSTVAGPFWVKGYIVGVIDGKALSTGAKFEAAAVASNMMIADDPGVDSVAGIVPVQLPAGFLRDALNLQDNPSNLKKEVMVYGTLEAYFSTNGVKNITKAYLDGKEVTKPEAVDGGVKTIAEALAIIDALEDNKQTAESYTIEGVVDTVTTKETDLPNYGNVDLIIMDPSDNTKKIKGYRISGGPNFDKNDKTNKPDWVTVLPKKGETVKIYGPLLKYIDKNNGNAVVPEIKEGWFVK